MYNPIRISPAAYLLLFILCFAPAAVQTQNLLDELISQHPEWGPWTQDPATYQAQVILTEIKVDSNEKPQLIHHYWGHEAGHYFYPASTIKMPVAALALQKLNELGIMGLTPQSSMRTGRGRNPQTAGLADPSAANGLPSIAHYIRKIFLVSDNQAYNRLFEFLGPTYINTSLRSIGLNESKIVHRVGVSGFGGNGNHYLNPVGFWQEDTLLYYQGERHDVWTGPTPQPQGFQRGIGYLSGDSIVNAPFDFSQKNYLSLADLHGILARIMLPAAFPPNERFALRPSDYALLRQPMSQLPRESNYPAYPDKADNYVKFWQFGDLDPATQIPDHIRVYNKVGWAYGYLTDVAYIEDTQAGIAYFLAGTIHVNANQIYNDGVYEYETIGLPFFGQLGRAIHKELTASD